MRRYFPLILLFAVLMSGLAGCSGHHGKSAEKWVDYVASKIQSDLDLKDDQITKLTDLANELNAVLKDSQSTDFKAEIRKMIESPSLDASQVKSVIQKRREEADKRFDSNFDRIFPKLKALNDSLSPEQRKKALECFDKNSKRWEHHH
jgi:Spy/CpxP family protein refolding chaperone